MKPKLPSFIFMMIASALCGILNASQSQTVGYGNVKLQKGNNRIEINFDAVCPLFSTLDMVVKFEPADGVLGDEVMFSLDGKMRCYRFSSFDGTNYVLSSVRESPSIVTTLDAIPWMPEFWIKHNSSTEVTITQSGGMGGEYERLERQWERDARHQAIANPVVVTFVDSGDPQKPKKIRLKGGHISLGE
jgi:hypothetical protein